MKNYGGSGPRFVVRLVFKAKLDPRTAPVKNNSLRIKVRKQTLLLRIKVRKEQRIFLLSTTLNLPLLVLDHSLLFGRRRSGETTATH